MIRKTLIPLTAALALVLPAQAFAAPKPKLNFSKSAYAVAENDSSHAATITVFRKGNAKRVNQAVNVDYSTADGSGRAGVDYVATSGTLQFASGETSKTFNVPVINNSTIDGARTVKLKLSHPTATNGRAVLGFPNAATLVIADDDSGSTTGSTFQMAAGTDMVSESQATEPVFIVRSGDLSATAAVNYSTANGSAIAGTDYTAVSGTANFTAGSDASAVLVEVDVPLLHNAATSPTSRDFAFNLSLVGGTVGQLGTPASETITIINADGTPTLQFSAPTYSVTEDGGSIRVSVFASGSITAADGVDVDYATADGSAIAGVNYTASADTLTFLADDVAESFDIPVMADGKLGDKAFSLALSNPSSPAVLGTVSSATVNVLNTDADTGAGGNGGATGNGGGAGTGDNGGNTGGTGGTTGQNQDGQVVLGARQAACGLKITVSKKQKLVKQKGLKLKLRSGQACKVAVTTKVKQVRSKSKRQAQVVRARSYSGKKASLTLQPGKAKTVKVKFTKKTLKAMKKALQARKKFVATVVVTTRDSASKVSRKTLKITIRR